jgi:hypothetical protein
MMIGRALCLLKIARVSGSTPDARRARLSSMAFGAAAPESDTAMLIMSDELQERVERTRVFAASVGELVQFENSLRYLAEYGGNPENVQTTLYPDFAMHSFGFSIAFKQADGTFKHWCSGGLIYDGPGAPCDGSFPQLTVNVNRNARIHNWGIHT